MRGVGHDRHPEPFRDNRDVDPAVVEPGLRRERDAALALARALGLDRPAGAELEIVLVDLQIVQDHVSHVRRGRRTGSCASRPIYEFIDKQNEDAMRRASAWLTAHPEYRPDLNAE